MGNCQAIDAASFVIQHPNGREERFYWPVIAKEIMESNPGFYVALIITLSMTTEEEHRDNNGVRITRIKVLKPTDTLNLGQSYRLIDSQEVMKGLWEKKFAKMKKKQDLESNEQSQRTTQNQETSSYLGEINQESKSERHRRRSLSSSMSRSSRHWRPSLDSISEAINQTTDNPRTICSKIG